MTLLRGLESPTQESWHGSELNNVVTLSRRIRLRMLIAAFVGLSVVLSLYMPVRDLAFAEKRWAAFLAGRDFGTVRSISFSFVGGTVSTSDANFAAAFRLAAQNGRVIPHGDSSPHKKIHRGTYINVLLDNGGTLSGRANFSGRGFVTPLGDSRGDWSRYPCREIDPTRFPIWSRFLSEAYRADYDATQMDRTLIDDWHLELNDSVRQGVRL